MSRVFRMLAFVTAVGLGAVACTQEATSPEALPDANSLGTAVTAADGMSARYVVVFHKKVPKDAAEVVADAGGELVTTFPEVGLGMATSSDPDFAESLQDADAVHSLGAER